MEPLKFQFQIFMNPKSQGIHSAPQMDPCHHNLTAQVGGRQSAGELIYDAILEAAPRTCWY